MSIFGTRPEAIKMAPVVRLLEAVPGITNLTCVTAQHREMLDEVLGVFQIQPNYDLGLMQSNQGIAHITMGVLAALPPIFQKEQPDLVLVHGDTTTAMSSSLAAFYARIPVYHVEAGLRTHNLSAPFPEEANRRLVSVLAQHHFAPTRQNRDNLLKENVQPEAITITGNTGIDALLLTLGKISICSEAFVRSRFAPDLAKSLLDENRKVVLVTAHRRENFGQGIDDICHALANLAERHGSWIIVYPVHRNPNVSVPVYNNLANYSNIHLIEHLPYDTCVYLMNRSDVILTDSGGIQEEAPSLGKTVLVLREATERWEAIDAGVAVLVGTNQERIVSTTESILDGSFRGNKVSNSPLFNPYGDGNAAQRIVDIIQKHWLSGHRLSV
ncbi:MAG: UDP-N-acetylglucosamine 2-epimerase (non-hydrolyzing) [Magnetococcales bacterium]|nr:UDP-N-acetylglucosamine 2-epimerase (non-hydrolyzing) [Magnetococcales bacterium]